MKHLRTTTMAIITAITLGITGCNTEPETINGFPTCTTTSNTTYTCLMVDHDDHGNGSGWLINPDGSTVKVNFFSDGEVEEVN